MPLMLSLLNAINLFSLTSRKDNFSERPALRTTPGQRVLAGMLFTFPHRLASLGLLWDVNRRSPVPAAPTPAQAPKQQEQRRGKT
jgi:hypothetical protein